MSDAERDELAGRRMLRCSMPQSRGMRRQWPQRPTTQVIRLSMRSARSAANFYTQLSACALGPRLRVNACSPGFSRTEIVGPAADYSRREPKSARLGGDVVLKLLCGAAGEGATGRLFKENSKPGTPLEEAQSVEQEWVA